MTDKSHTLAKVLFVLGWIALLGPGLIYEQDAGVRSRVLEIVRAELLTTARAANFLLPPDSAAAMQAR